MQVLNHHIYEYKKGLRNLVLHTIAEKQLKLAETKLRKHAICYISQKVGANKINIFFGAQECVEVIAKFGNKMLNKFTPEEDFILGIMLGYDRIKQCRRYSLLKQKEILSENENLQKIS